MSLLSPMGTDPTFIDSSSSPSPTPSITTDGQSDLLRSNSGAAILIALGLLVALALSAGLCLSRHHRAGPSSRQPDPRSRTGSTPRSTPRASTWAESRRSSRYGWRSPCTIRFVEVERVEGRAPAAAPGLDVRVREEVERDEEAEAGLPVYEAQDVGGPPAYEPAVLGDSVGKESARPVRDLGDLP